MHRLPIRLSAVVLGASLLALSPLAGVAEAQDSKSAALAKELTSLLDQKKLDSVAAKRQGAQDEFVAALYFPGQLLVVSARYSAPTVLSEKIARSEFRDVYIDLNAACIPETKVLITDMGADGLKAKRAANMPFDTQDAMGKGTIRFDGNWREDKMSEADYMKIFTEADEAYVSALQALIGSLKKTS